MMHYSLTNMTRRYKFGADSYQQRGSTLLVALIMLVLLTLMALSAINSTTSSIQVVGNAQFREEANAAAQQAIEKVISSNFSLNPTAAATAVNALSPVTFGAASYAVNVAVPSCKNSEVMTRGAPKTAVTPRIYGSPGYEAAIAAYTNAAEEVVDYTEAYNASHDPADKAKWDAAELAKSNAENSLIYKQLGTCFQGEKKTASGATQVLPATLGTYETDKSSEVNLHCYEQKMGDYCHCG